MTEVRKVTSDIFTSFFFQLLHFLILVDFCLFTILKLTGRYENEFDKKKCFNGKKNEIEVLVEIEF